MQQGYERLHWEQEGPYQNCFSTCPLMTIQTYKRWLFCLLHNHLQSKFINTHLSLFLVLPHAISCVAGWFTGMDEGSKQEYVHVYIWFLTDSVSKENILPAYLNIYIQCVHVNQVSRTFHYSFIFFPHMYIIPYIKYTLHWLEGFSIQGKCTLNLHNYVHHPHSKIHFTATKFTLG